MKLSTLITPDSANKPFESYNSYIQFLFACADNQLCIYLENMKPMLLSNDGSYKNILYPDIELAHDLCKKHLSDFSTALQSPASTVQNPQMQGLSDDSEIFNDLFASMQELSTVFSEHNTEKDLSITEFIDSITYRAKITDIKNVFMPLFILSENLQLSPFALFCLICAILSATQTNYAAIFQIINQNSALSAPTIESAARIYFGNTFSISNGTRSIRLFWVSNFSRPSS